jgi:hypothetical protein
MMTRWMIFAGLIVVICSESEIFRVKIHLRNCCSNDWFDAEIIDEFYLLNCWSTDWTFWSSIESDCCLFNDSKIGDDDRCLIDWSDDDRCLIDWDDDDRCVIDWDRFLIDNFPLFRCWIDWVDRSRNDNWRADSDFCDPDRDCAVCHE